jgi:hypothetical protein
MTIPLFFSLSSEQYTNTFCCCGGGSSRAQKLDINNASHGTTLFPQGREEGNILGSNISLLGR